jgi:hypothetical protein
VSRAQAEYGLRPGVRNRSIVREIDRARIREMWQWAAVLAGLALVLIFSVWQHFQVLRFGYLIEDMRRQRIAEEEVRRHLILDRAVLLRPQRLERIATGPLQLVTPAGEATVMVERVRRSPPPGRGVVAASSLD